jgi:oligo-1,6-glucosidase
VTVNATDAVADSNSVFHHYRRLIALRHEMEVVVHGDFTLLVPDHPQLFAYVRSLGSVSLLVVANLSGSECRFDAPPDFADAEVLLGNRSESLAPWQSYVVLLGDAAA